MPDEDSPFAPIEEAVAAIAAGELVVVVDDEDRENEGDLIMAAVHATTEKMAFMIRHTSGLICAPLTNERATTLDLPLMVEQNTESMRTAFTVSVDLVRRDHDRHLRRGPRRHRPGAGGRRHRPPPTWPVRATSSPSGPGRGACSSGRATPRPASTSASWPGCPAVAVICEMVNDDGTMARLPRLAEFAREHGLVLISIADLIRYRHRHEKLVQRVGEARIPTQWGDFQLHRLPLEPRRLRARGHGPRRRARARRPCWCGCTRSA